MKLRTLIPFLLGLACPASCFLQEYPLSIFVRDAISKAPIARASVFVDGLPSTTNSDGEVYYNRVRQGRVNSIIVSKFPEYMVQEITDFNVSSDPDDNIRYVDLNKKTPEETTSPIVTGLLQDKLGEPLEGVRLTITIAGGEQIISDSTNNAGFYRCVLPNRKELQVLKLSFSHADYQTIGIDSFVQPGEVWYRKVILYRKFKSIKGSVHPSKIGKNLSINSDNYEINQITNFDGSFEIRALSPFRSDSIQLYFFSNGYRPATGHLDIENITNSSPPITVTLLRDCSSGPLCWMLDRSYVLPGIHNISHNSPWYGIGELALFGGGLFGHSYFKGKVGEKMRERDKADTQSRKDDLQKEINRLNTSKLLSLGLSGTVFVMDLLLKPRNKKTTKIPVKVNTADGLGLSWSF